MALGESRQVFDTNIDCTVSGVAERGGIMSFVPGVNGLCGYANAAAVSGALVNPAGLLLDDVEAMNFMNHPEYRQRNVVPEGSVVGLLTEGEVLTDFVETATADGFSVGTYAPGDVLYMGDAGQVSRQQVLSARIVVGRALSTVDANGFLKARIEL
jgi:hypothetical protein